MIKWNYIVTTLYEYLHGLSTYMTFYVYVKNTRPLDNHKQTDITMCGLNL